MRHSIFVYVIRFSDNDHKIGVSIKPAQRLGTLRPSGATEVVRTWSRRGDAFAVESMAHHLLADRRISIGKQRERFRISGEAACMAVELAIRILADDQEAKRRKKLLEAARAADMQVVRLSPPAPMPRREMFGPFLPSPPLKIGYVWARTSEQLKLRRDVLLRAGVQDFRIYSDRGQRPGPGLLNARKACREGDHLLLIEADAETRIAVEAKGAQVVLVEG